MFTQNPTLSNAVIQYMQVLLKQLQQEREAALAVVHRLHNQQSSNTGLL